MATPKQCRIVVSRSPRHRAWRTILLGLSLVSLPVYSIGDTYLEMIEKEAQTLEMDPVLVDSPEQVRADPVILSKRRVFEQELKRLYEGSYLFYTKLPERSREEVFIEYNQGASLEQVRKTIIDRFLHSR